MDRRIAPSVQIEEAIEAVLLDGISGPDHLSQLGRLGAQLILQRAVEEEVAIFLGRSRYQRTPDAAGSRNGHRTRRIQTAEGEIAIAMPQVRGSLERFVSAYSGESDHSVRSFRSPRSEAAKRPTRGLTSPPDDHLLLDVVWVVSHGGRGP